MRGAASPATSSGPTACEVTIACRTSAVTATQPNFVPGEGIRLVLRPAPRRVVIDQKLVERKADQSRRRHPQNLAESGVGIARPARLHR